MAVRLVSLDPRWISVGLGRYGQGLSFLCPCCHVLRVRVYFENPLDDGPAMRAQRTWLRLGTTFEDVTLEPDIDMLGSGHWLGRIRRGDLVSP